MMAAMPELSRRAVLRLGTAAGALGVGSLLGARPARATPALATMTTGSFASAARGGIATNWAIARPPGQTEALRPLIALHGKGSDAATVMAGGVEQG
ncbi:MAG: alpha/beta hydrolase, partial [Actinomycetota bacterium]|nr:alpha/beta hydrolase [Actinomycetota bacterium]